MRQRDRCLWLLQTPLLLRMKGVLMLQMLVLHLELEKGQQQRRRGDSRRRRWQRTGRRRGGGSSRRRRGCARRGSRGTPPARQQRCWGLWARGRASGNRPRGPGRARRKRGTRCRTRGCTRSSRGGRSAAGGSQARRTRRTPSVTASTARSQCQTSPSHTVSHSSFLCLM